MDTPETKRFDRYQIVAELGRGAMGVVYKARDPQIDRLVALKTVSLLGSEREQEEEFRKMFRYEAQAAGRLHHPSIVTVFDVGEDSESQEPYIVLEYVAGESLSRILSRQKKLPFPTALQLAEELAAALDYAHAQGVVHRDIKPANILITGDGHAKLADFGIAKLNLAHFTLPGRILGTPAFMAPEQLSGEGVDGRSDLFSLGVILYIMVIGHSPFPGNSATTVCFKVVNREPVPVSSFDLDLPRSLDAVIARAMAKDPAERYQRGSEFAADLRHLREQYKPGSTTTSRWAVAASASSAGSRKAFQSLGGAPTGLARVEQRVRTAFAKAKRKDLIFAAAAVVALIILGIPLREAATSRKAISSVQSGLSASPNRANGAGSVPGAQQNSEAPGLMLADATVPGTSSRPIAANAAPEAVPGRKTEPQLRLNQEPATQRALKQGIVPASTLQLTVQHQFKEATLWVWIDDKLALTRLLHGGNQKHLVVFNGVRGIDSETLKVPAGTHLLRLRAQTTDQSIDLSKTISGNFISGADKTLRITFDKHNTAIHLSWQ